MIFNREEERRSLPEITAPVPRTLPNITEVE
jgi:hypothetical protein